MMAQTRLTTSWRGNMSEPTTAANCGDNWYGRVKPVPVNMRNEKKNEKHQLNNALSVCELL